MDVTKNHAQRHSEQEFSNEFRMLVDSGAGVVHVRATEILRASYAIRKSILLDGGELKEWDVVNGFREFKLENYTDEGVAGDGNSDINSAFAEPLGVLRDSSPAMSTKYYVFIGPHTFMESNPYMHQLLLLYNEFLPGCRACVVLVTPDTPLPDSPASGSILSLHFHTPGLIELRQQLTDLIKDSITEFEDGVDLDEDDIDKVCYAGAGMTALQFETYVSLSSIRSAANGASTLNLEGIIGEVQRGKTDIVNSNDILELYPSTEIGDVGGMEILKEWVHKRSGCYSDDAREFGIEPPKGMVLVGPPGTGKSLVAKAVAGVLGVPLVRLDFGKVFSSFVGSSEQRIRSALHMVESMSPCVLFCDEIDKGLGGIAGGGGSDSGVSMRVLGSFLTWLQDSTYPVFTMVTANNVTGLPPELLRRGRFDAIFSTGLPTPRERREVLAIHLRKRGRDIAEFDDAEVNKVIEKSDRYVPAEIEAAVKDGLIDAFSSGVDFALDHVASALGTMVPLSKAFAAQIEQMESWAKNNATPVSGSAAETRHARVANRSRISNRRRA